jgi:hypothetical protein
MVLLCRVFGLLSGSLTLSSRLIYHSDVITDFFSDSRNYDNTVSFLGEVDPRTISNNFR